jgi:hypothetical protein
VQQVSWWQAWELWWSGKALSGYALWGMPMLWWGRIGKLAQFTGGLVAIIDIIGPDRIQAWGQRLRERSRGKRRRLFLVTAKRSGAIYREVFGDLVDTFQRAANSRPGSPGYGRRVPRRELSPEAIRVRWVVRVVYVLLVVAGYAWMFWYDSVKTPSNAEPAWWWTPVLVIGAMLVLMIAPWLLILVLIAASLVVNLAARFWPVALYYLVVWPPLLLLRGPQPDRSLRVVGVLLVVAGFSFDLLAA